MRLPGFTAEGSLYITQGYKTVGTPRVGMGSRSVRAQMVLPPGGPPGKISICEIFPWLCVDPCAYCGANRACRCVCGGGYWNGYYCE
jgi:hypothetical protein